MKILTVLKNDYLLNISLVITLSISFFLRFYQLENYPLQVNQDELSNIYDGYSITETGADRWGDSYPLILRGFGDPDYRPPMYAWMCAASIKVFGYSIFSGRFPAALIGCISLILLYVVSKKIGGILFGFFALLLAGLSPWHILFSRMALEATTLPAFFIILTIFLWIKVKEENYNIKYLVLLGFTIGLATNDYQSTKLIFFLLSVITSIEVVRNTLPRIRKIVYFGLSVFVGALPQIIAALTAPDHFFSRASGTMMKFSFSFEYFEKLLSNFFANLSPHYLFFSFGEFNNLSIVRLLTVEVLFFYIGLVLFYRFSKKNILFNSNYIYLILIIALLPSALTIDNPHALRASSSIILFPLFTSAGIVFIFNGIKSRLYQNTFVGVMVILILSNSAYFTYKYVNGWDLRVAGHQNELVQAFSKLNKYKNDYSKIYIEDIGIQPYIYVASYCQIKPREFQLAIKNFESNGWDHFIQLDKYYFLSKEAIEKIPKDTIENRLYLLRSKNDNYTLLDSIIVPWKHFYFYKDL